MVMDRRCGNAIPALQVAKMRYIPAMQRLKRIFWTAFVLIIFVGGVWLGFMVRHWLKSGSGLREENTATVVEQVQTLSDLVTVKYVLEKVVILEDAKWYGENRVLLLAHGIVKAGMDLKRITPDDVTISGKKISLRLPPPQIMDAYLDDAKSQVIDHTTGLLRAFDKDLEQTARANAVDDIRRAARADGILDEADKRARLELELFLRQAGFEQVEFR
jgi:spore coat protein CotH